MESLNMVNGTHDKSSEERLPPGFRFHPTDEELVTYYLTKKILDSSFSGRAITEVDLNKCEPWDLPGKAKMGEKEWYFFSLRDRKYPTGLRTNRATEAGYWKTTGKDREIFNSRTSALVGMKKTLVFYKGRAPKGEKTNWVMHEYRLEGKFSYHRLPKNCKDEWVVCRIFQKSAGGKKNSMGLNRNSYLELDSPSLPSLLESPYNTNAVNEQETGSIESESGTSAKGHVSCFSTAMEAINNRSGTLIGPHHIQPQRGSNTNPADSAELSDMTRIIRNSSYMQTIMFNDPRFNMNMMPALSSLSNLRRDQNAMHPQQGIQQLPLPPPLLFSPMSALPSSSLTFNPADANISAQVGLPSNAMLRALANQPSANGISLNMEPSSSYGVHDKQGNDKSLGANGFHWVHDSSQQQQPQQQQQINMEGNGVSQSISAHEPVVSIQQETCLNTDMNEEMSSVVCNRLNRPYQVDPSSAAPVDLDSFWNY